MATHAGSEGKVFIGSNQVAETQSHQIGVESKVLISGIPGPTGSSQDGAHHLFELIGRGHIGILT